MKIRQRKQEEALEHSNQLKITKDRILQFIANLNTSSRSTNDFNSVLSSITEKVTILQL